MKYESSSFKFNTTTKSSTEFFKELLQELYILLLNEEFEDGIDHLNEFVNNYLFESDLDPKNAFEIMTSNSQNISCYSSFNWIFLSTWNWM